MSNDSILKNKTRLKIYSLIVNNPGLHLMELKRKLAIPKTTLKYHLKCLEKNKLILSNCDYGYKRFFASNQFGIDDKKILGVLRQKVPRQIIYYLCCYVSGSEMEIAQELEKDQSTISYHLQKLMDVNIIEHAPYNKGEILTKKGSVLLRNRISNEIFYRIVDMAYLKSLLIKYENIFKDDEVAQHIIILTKHQKKTGFTFNKIKTKNDRWDDMLDLLYDIFPNPYCV